MVALSNEIERLPARFVLVLDDYHAIRGEAVHDFLSELLRHWPQPLHLVLISRSNPPLPVANLRAKGQVAEIRARDLRFTPEEATAFLEKVSAAPLSPATVALLDQRLEGWIAGLRLVSLSLGTGANADTELAGLSGNHVEIADYLVDEVISCQTPAILRFLLVTSILDRFCAALCEWILGSASGSTAGGGDGPPCDVSVCIQWLESNNLFVIPLDNDRRWYRYHHLFQELLQRRLLAEVGTEQVIDLHRRAAAWFAGQGLIDEALHHALAADDLDLAARLMASGAVRCAQPGGSADIGSLAAPAAGRVHPASPLALDDAGPMHFSSPGSSPPCGSCSTRSRRCWTKERRIALRSARRATSGDPHDLRALRGLIALLRGQEAFSNSQAARAIACCEEALALLPEGWRYARGGALIYWGMSMRASGRGDVAQRTLIDEYESLPWKTDAYAVRLLLRCVSQLPRDRPP